MLDSKCSCRARVRDLLHEKTFRRYVIDDAARDGMQSDKAECSFCVIQESSVLPKAKVSAERTGWGD